ncbi:MFS general substrate transporter [Athelia psychrophila]|uniref:MFS general substrate transporter n=1 Tax=Athelia psychrophila TaxID=1759441 RepID=A0A166ESE7_9AGAM|nr:MFS general substrate transporter [Fibularhizoctonia sp. CBS 109695]
MYNSTERDPFISPTTSTAGHDYPKAVGQPGALDITRSTRLGILAGIWTASFLSVILPSISSEFNKSNQASWLGPRKPFHLLRMMLGRYLLALCTFTPLYGRLCNMMGRRDANQTAVFLAGLGTLCCGLSTNMYMLIAARFLGGLGGGGVNTTASIITSDMYSLRDRGLAQGVSSVFNGLGVPAPAAYISHIARADAGKGKSTKEVLKRIDWGGTFTLLWRTRYNEDLPWSNVTVIVPLVLACVFAVDFVVVELFIAPEPVMAPFLLRQKVPVLVGLSNFLVSINNFAIMYFFPMWFQTVALTSAATAAQYKTLNLTFGLLPFLTGVLICLMREDSPAAQQWLSIIPLGFGNTVVYRTMLKSQMAVGTGFGQVFRGLGQVGGLGIASALFQSVLGSELEKRIHGPDAAKLIKNIRHSSRLVASLPPDIQRDAREAYATSLKAVSTLAACASFLAFVVRLPVPEMKLDSKSRPRKRSTSVVPSRPLDGPVDSVNANPTKATAPLAGPRLGSRRRGTRRPYWVEGSMDSENERFGGSASRGSVLASRNQPIS